MTTQKSASIPSTLTPPSAPLDVRGRLLEPDVEPARERERKQVGAATDSEERGRVATDAGLLDVEEERQVLGLDAVCLAQLVTEEKSGAVGKAQIAHQPRSGARIEGGRGAHAARRARGTDRCPRPSCR